MKVVKDGEKLVIRDGELNVDCIFEGSKVKGKGARKYKDEIDKAISDYQKSTLFQSVGDKKAINFANLTSSLQSWGSDYKYLDYSIEDLKRFESNPVYYNKKLRDLSMYWYSQKGIITQTYNLYRNYHSLDSQLEISDPTNSSVDKDKALIREFDNAIYKKTLIRDCIFEAIAKGTAIGYITGRGKGRYIQYLNQEYYLPYRIVAGHWQVQVDLLKFATEYNQFKNRPKDWIPDNFTESKDLFLQPREIQRAFRRMRETGNRVYNISMDKTFVIKNMATQEERLGRPLGIGAFIDLLHKDLIREGEKSIIERVINMIMVLNMGSSNKDCQLDLSEAEMKTLYDAIKRVMESDTNGFKLLGLPEWANISSVSTNLELFDKSKYEQIDVDIATGLGVNGLFSSDDGGSFASGQLSLKILIANIFAVLEQIEESLFNYQYALLTKDSEVTYKRKFNRALVADEGKIVEILKSLSDKGFSIKHLVESLGVSFDDYIKQTEYETDELKLQEKIKPYQSTSTLGANGRPSGDNAGDNKSSNNTPRPT